MAKQKAPPSDRHTLKCFILRGLPGAGKSTWAQQYAKKHRAVVCSADDYRTRIVDGVARYVFDRDRASMDHNLCLMRALIAFGQGVCDVVIDNTNATALEIAPYYRLAEAHVYQPLILEFPVAVEVAAARNTHEVPWETLVKMEQQLAEPLPARWKVDNIQARAELTTVV